MKVMVQPPGGVVPVPPVVPPVPPPPLPLVEPLPQMPPELVPGRWLELEDAPPLPDVPPDRPIVEPAEEPRLPPAAADWSFVSAPGLPLVLGDVPLTEPLPDAEVPDEEPRELAPPEVPLAPAPVLRLFDGPASE